MSDEEENSRNPGWTKLLDGPWVPILLSLICFAPTLLGEFVADDVADILRHPVVQGDEPFWKVLSYNFMGQPVGEGVNTIRPLTTLMFMAEYAVFGQRPWLFHLVSLLCYGALVGVFHTFCARFVPRRLATLGAALFAALAIHVDAVALLSHRAEVLAFLFALLSLHLGLSGRWLLGGLCLLLGLLSKESAVFVPVALASCVVVMGGWSGLKFWTGEGRSVSVAVYGVIVMVFVAIRSTILPLAPSVLEQDNMLLTASAGGRLWTPLVLLGRYLSSTILPVDLAFDHTYSAIPIQPVDLLQTEGWIGALSLLLLGALLLWAIKGRGDKSRADTSQAVLIAIAGFASSYILFSNSVFLIVIIYAERLFLGPSAFVVLLVVGLASRTESWPARTRRLLLGLAMVVLVVQGATAALHSQDYQTDLTLWTAQVAAQPNSVKGRLALATLLAREGRHGEALWHLGVASAGRVTYPEPFQSPVEADSEEIAVRLALLPRLLAPDVHPSAFWTGFHSNAGALLGPSSLSCIEALIATPDPRSSSAWRIPCGSPQTGQGQP